MAAFHFSGAVFFAVLLVSLGDEALGDEKLPASNPLICTPRGISLKMDNGMYWSSTDRGIKGQTKRDYTTRFQLCRTNMGKWEITDYKNEFLSLTPGSPVIKMVQQRNTPSTEFELINQDEKLTFKASNRMFLSRIYYLANENHILEAQKEATDVFCLFDLVVAEC